MKVKVLKLKKGETVILSETEIIKAITRFISECDCDDLAMLAGHMFGGKCYYKIEEEYVFVPDENYGGAFDDFERDEQVGESISDDGSIAL